MFSQDKSERKSTTYMGQDTYQLNSMVIHQDLDHTQF